MMSRRWDGDARSAARLIAGARAAGQARRCAPGSRSGSAGLAHLLALSGRRRRAAAFRLRGIAERQSGRGAVAGAAAAAGGRPRHDRLRPRRDPAAAGDAAGRGQAGHAAAQARLRDLREAVRAGPDQGRARARGRRRARRTRDSPPPRRASRARLRSAPGQRARDPRRSGATAGAATGRASWSTWRRRRARPSTCSPRARRRSGRCRCRSRSTARRRGLQRFMFELDGAPPGAKYEGALISLTAVTAADAIEVPIHLD